MTTAVAPDYAKAWRLRNPEQSRLIKKAARLRLRERNRLIVDEYKATTPCADCGQSFPAVAMDFHHRDPNEKDTKINRMVHLGRSLERLQAEMAKCDVLCAVCHRLRHNSGGRN